MAVTLASLVAIHHEFADTATNYPDVVNDAIAQAKRRIDESLLGDRYDDAVMWLACDIIEQNPYGRDIRMSKEGVQSYYYQQYLKICRTAGTAYRMVF